MTIGQHAPPAETFRNSSTTWSCVSGLMVEMGTNNSNQMSLVDQHEHIMFMFLAIYQAIFRQNLCKAAIGVVSGHYIRINPYCVLCRFCWIEINLPILMRDPKMP